VRGYSQRGGKLSSDREMWREDRGKEAGKLVVLWQGFFAFCYPRSYAEEQAWLNQLDQQLGYDAMVSAIKVGSCWPRGVWRLAPSAEWVS
jgi:hypothetical protein